MKGGSLTVNANHKTYTGAQPYEIFAQIAGYVVPTNAAFAGTQPS